MPLHDVMTVGEAALELGLSPISVRDAIRRGALTGVRIDRRTWGVSREEVAHYKRESLGQRGRRKKGVE
jgi:excisionase family DNA binding protein